MDDPRRDVIAPSAGRMQGASVSSSVRRRWWNGVNGPAMQSVLVYGRLLTRALVNGAYSYSNSTEVPCRKRDFEPQLVTAWSGFPKDFASNPVLRKGQFGDDAYVIARHKTVDVLGVADGVGGWRTYGIDPSQFSVSLMKTCERLISLGRFNPRSPSSIIANSYYELLESKDQIIGSSTVCVVVLNRADRKVYTANIGDSGFLVVRRGKVVHRSEDQQHYFNTPFQLSLAPPGQSGQVLSDSPESATTSSFSVKDGDLILLGSDGLFDNMTDKMIVKELANLTDHNLDSMQKTANSLAFQARQLAFDEKYESPFAIKARENGIPAIGGKPDDVTVLLATVAM